MNRREALHVLAAAGVLGLPPRLSFSQARRSLAQYSIQGPSNAPTVMAFDRMPAGYYTALAKSYRVVVLLDYPPRDDSQAFVESFTADHVTAYILYVADAVKADRFAWFGFSWGAVVGLQLAIRTQRLAALACGGWPPLGGQYAETLAVTEAIAATGVDRHYATYYASLRDWNERDAVSTIKCPRFVFAGAQDQFVAEGHSIRIGPLVSEHRAELEQLGWKVRLIGGFGHELGARPDVIIPLLREFLDSAVRRTA